MARGSGGLCAGEGMARGMFEARWIRGDSFRLERARMMPGDFVPLRRSVSDRQLSRSSTLLKRTHRLLDLITHSIENDRKVSSQDKRRQRDQKESEDEERDRE